MSTIYKESHGVYAWLGQEEGGSDAVMNAINSASRHLFLRGYFASNYGRVPVESDDEFNKSQAKPDENIFGCDRATGHDAMTDVDNGMRMLFGDPEPEFEMLSTAMEPLR